jgi:hypothetical protein
MASALVTILLETHESYAVELYLMDRFGQMSREDFFVFFESFAARKFGLIASPDPTAILHPPTSATAIMDPGQAKEAERRHQVYLMLRHLDARRTQLESDLLRVLSGQPSGDGSTLALLREQLEQVQALRHSYETQLDASACPAAEVGTAKSVFVSSTSADLKSYRQAVSDAIKKLQFKFIGMEEFPATRHAPADLIQRKLNEARIYCGLLGLRYGYVDPGTGLSMTELEYRQAVASDKEICFFVLDPNAPILASMVEDDPVRYAKLIDFRARVMRAHTCALFLDPPDLAAKVERTLNQGIVPL